MALGRRKPEPLEAPAPSGPTPEPLPPYDAAPVVAYAKALVAKARALRCEVDGFLPAYLGLDIAPIQAALEPGVILELVPDGKGGAELHIAATVAVLPKLG